MLIVCIIIWIAFALLFVCTRRYRKDEIERLKEESRWFKFFYPCALFLYDKLGGDKLIKKQAAIRKRYNILTRKRDSFEGFRQYTIKKLVLSMLTIMAAVLFAGLMELDQLNKKKESRYISVPTGQQGTRIFVEMRVDQRRSDRLEFEVEPSIQPETEQDQQKASKYSRAYSYLDERLLAANEELNKVGTDLTFVTSIPEMDIAVRWTTSQGKLITEQGEVHNETIKEPQMVHVRAEIAENSGVILGAYEVNVTVIPKDQYEYEQWKLRLQEKVTHEIADSEPGTVYILPSEFEDKTIEWKEERSVGGEEILLLGILAAVVLFVVKDEELKDQVKKREQEMQQDYPNIVNKLALLMGAGMTMKGAWERIMTDYLVQKEAVIQAESKKNSKKWFRYAYEEIGVMTQELSLGVSEAAALERFGKRAGTIEYMKLSGALIQNLKKGSDGLIRILNLMSEEAFVNRQQRARSLGEEAGTKLLIPMMVMLLIVLVIIMVPAFWSMRAA